MTSDLMTRVIAIVLILSSSVVAQEQTPSPEYEQLIQRALAESAEGRWEEARVLFRRAHEAFPNARTLRGIGMVAYQLRDYTDAIHHLRLALTDERRPLSEEQRSQAQGLLDESYAFVARYNLSAVPEGAQLIVDGHAAEREPDNTLILSVGPHHVVARTATSSWEGRFIVRGGEQEPIPMLFEEANIPPPREQPPLPSAVEIVPSGPPDTTVPWILGVSGAAAFVAGIAILIAGVVDFTTVQNAMMGTRWPTLSGAYGRAPVLTGLGIALSSVGLAAGATGFTWIGFASASAPSDVQAQLQWQTRW
jgi:hypothetical protein